MERCDIIISRMGKIARYLNQLTVGNVFDSQDILDAYAVDRSVLKIKPRIVALPESTDDVRKLLRFSYQLAAKGINLPVTVRGAGLDETGADLGNGMVISTEKLNRLLEADRRERLVRVQAGITLKELNTALSLSGLTIPIEEHENNTIGGLISNCPVSPCDGKYGGIAKYVERIEVVLSNGDILQTETLNRRTLTRKASEKSLEGTIYRKISEIAAHTEALDEIATTKGQVGYHNITKVSSKKTFNLLPLFFGAQGTLGVITEVILRAVPIRKPAKRVAATFEDYHDAEVFLEAANRLHPRVLDIYDIDIIRIAEETGKRLSDITSSLESGFVVYAEYDTRRAHALKKLAKLERRLPKTSRLIIESPATEVALNELQNSLGCFLNQARSEERPPIVTDFYVPRRNMSSFINDLEVVGNGLKLDLKLYGSYGAENYHLRPKFDVDENDFNKKATAFLRAGAYIIKRQRGELTFGAPEGRVKALVTNAEMPDTVKTTYLGIKKVFDKYDIMNPAVKLGADARFTLRHFRNTAGKIAL